MYGLEVSIVCAEMQERRKEGMPLEMFADAIEASAKNRPVRVPVSAREITEEAELIEFMEKWEKANVGNK